MILTDGTAGNLIVFDGDPRTTFPLPNVRHDATLTGLAWTSYTTNFSLVPA
jgi:hypothetical protein